MLVVVRWLPGRPSQPFQSSGAGVIILPQRIVPVKLTRMICIDLINRMAFSHGLRRGIVHQTISVISVLFCRFFGVINVLVAGETAEHEPAQQTGQHMVGVLAPPALRQRRTRHIGQFERVVQLAAGEQSGIGGDAAVMEFQLQATLEIEPQSAINRLARRVFDAPTAMSNTTS
jgi:hypothetical protein